MKLAGVGANLVDEIIQKRSAEKRLGRNEGCREHSEIHLFNGERADANTFQDHFCRLDNFPVSDLQVKLRIVGAGDKATSAAIDAGTRSSLPPNPRSWIA